jgi:peptidoglycan/xylan/chitin deacetylase (PgdA/CDA1 family)
VVALLGPVAQSCLRRLLRSISRMWSLCCHGFSWVEQFRLSEDEQREHIRQAVAASLERTVRRGPSGWYWRYAPG